jgi:mannose-1-phosphate guanylyltransferase
MKKNSLYPVILAGGQGSRLWPLSTSDNPKQFKKIYSNFSFFQQAINRINNDIYSTPIIICNKKYESIVKKQLRELQLKKYFLLLEPLARNTAPAICIAAEFILNKLKGENFCVLSADHLISEDNKFQKSINKALKLIDDNKIITFGILPNKPETGYGYLKVESIKKPSKLQKFTEKPSIYNAKKYLKERNYLWNSGIFLFNCKKIINDFEQLSPDILLHCKKSLNLSRKKGSSYYLDSNSFASCENISIDYAILEKTKNIWVVPLESKWSDIGSWSALFENLPKDKNNNAFKGFVKSISTSNCLIHAQEKKISIIGCNNLIIVEEGKDLLICNADQDQDVKKLLS